MISFDAALNAMPGADKRLVRLQRNFGMRKPFTLADGASALGLDLAAAFELFHNELEDGYVRVSANHRDWWLLPVCPTKIAAHDLWKRYRPLWDNESFLTPAQISWKLRLPLPSVNWTLSVLVQNGYLSVLMGPGNGVATATYQPKRTRRVLFKGDRRARVIYTGH